jgi:hypothetical protein
MDETLEMTWIPSYRPPLMGRTIGVFVESDQ